MGVQLPPGSLMVRIFRNVSQRQSLKKEFRMHCNALGMLYQKDGPLRRSSECIGLHNVVPKDGPLRSSDHFFAKCML